MKRFLIFILLFFSLPIIVGAESISITSAEIIEHTEGLNVFLPKYDGLNITIDNEFLFAGDYVKYKFVIQNNEDKQVVVNTSVPSDDYIKYDINEPIIEPHSSTELIISVLYEKEIDNEIFERNTEIAVELKSLEPVPNTLDDTSIVFISFLVVSLCVYGVVIIFYNKKVQYTIPLFLGILGIGSLLFINNSYANVSINITSNVDIIEQIPLFDIIKNDSLGSSSSINFNVSSQYAEEHYLDDITNPNNYANKAGVYQLDGKENVYFYRGSVDNNFILFGGFCWQMVRTMENGDVKVIYSGIPEEGKCISSNRSIGSVGYNYAYNNKIYVGYTYNLDGIETDSNVKAFVDEWYENNLIDYSSYIDDVPYCNERKEISVKDPRMARPDTSYFNLFYEAAARVSYDSMITSPSLECSSEDMYTVSIENGNGKLKYPIALITTDELGLAGTTGTNNGKWKSKPAAEYKNNTFYLFYSGQFWTMSPYGMAQRTARVIYSAYDGGVGHSQTEVIVPNRPVIALKPTVCTIDGDGTSENPYVLNIRN